MRLAESAPPSAFVGCLLGGAVGDALGLPYEGLGPRRAARLFPNRRRHHLVFGKGMLSDDSEHAAFVAQALLRCQGDPDRFARHLAWSLRFWLLGLPAGVGLATGRAIIKLLLGFPPRYSGVFSAGNGPAMRAPLLGVALGHDPRRLRLFVRASTIITHRDPKAYHGALAVALAAWRSATAADPVAEDYLANLETLLTDEGAEQFLGLVHQALTSARQGTAAAEFAQSIGSRNGVSGYIYHTVPVVLQVWFRYGRDYAGAIQEVIAAGGDTDTSAAILGGIIGAAAGKEGIPAPWRQGIIDWPRGIGWLERLAEALAAQQQGRASKPPGYFYPALPLRNLLFLALVLLHGFRRLAPPY